MSNIGLNSNIYHSTRIYLDLLNNFLIDLNYAKEIGKPYTNDQVVDFFKKIIEKSDPDPEVRLLRSFFNRYYNEKRKDTKEELTKIITSLLNADLDKTILDEIESLVDVLKYQCAQSYARMKGVG